MVYGGSSLLDKCSDYLQQSQLKPSQLGDLVLQPNNGEPPAPKPEVKPAGPAATQKADTKPVSQTLFPGKTPSPPSTASTQSAAVERFDFSVHPKGPQSNPQAYVSFQPSASIVSSGSSSDHSYSRQRTISPSPSQTTDSVHSSPDHAVVKAVPVPPSQQRQWKAPIVAPLLPTRNISAPTIKKPTTQEKKIQASVFLASLRQKLTKQRYEEFLGFMGTLGQKQTLSYERVTAQAVDLLGDHPMMLKAFFNYLPPQFRERPGSKVHFTLPGAIPKANKKRGSAALHFPNTARAFSVVPSRQDGTATKKRKFQGSYLLSEAKINLGKTANIPTISSDISSDEIAAAAAAMIMPRPTKAKKSEEVSYIWR